ncbi:MAG: hypothetical protein LUO94_02250 [Methylococcaceae bacterium]|nr:hypothetical protein [Methylococcaceae bacterium]
MDNRNLRGLTMGLVSPALVKGANKSYTTTVTSAGIINGKYVTPLTAQTAQAVPTTDATTGAAFVALATQQATVVVVGQNAAGTIQASQGTIVPTALGVTTTAGSFINYPQFPALPADFIVFGYLLARTAPSATSWTFGTDNWAATGVTCTEFVQCAVLPARPTST